MTVYGYCTTHECKEYTHMNLGYFGFYHDITIVNKKISHPCWRSSCSKRAYKELSFVKKAGLKYISL